MFVRIKNISGKKYAYLVENKWKKGRVKQHVKKYLGPVVQTEKREDDIPFSQWKNVEAESYISTTKTRRIMQDLVRHTVMLHWFSEEPMRNNNVIVDVKKGTVTRDEKNVVLQMNEGFLHRDSLKRLLNFKKIEEERPGETLAHTLTDAGLKVEKNVFILLYRKIWNV